jgi:hypothetical protein
VGDYFVSASASGFEAQEKIVTVTENETIVVNFELEELSSVKVETNVDKSYVFLDGEMVYGNPFNVKPGKYEIQAFDSEGHQAKKMVDVYEGYNNYKLRIPYWSFSESDAHIDLGAQILPYPAFGFGFGYNGDNLNMDYVFTLGGKSNIGFVDSNGEYQWFTPTFSFAYVLGYAIIPHDHFRVTPQAFFLYGGYRSSYSEYSDDYWGGEVAVKCEYALDKHIAVHLSPSWRFVDLNSADPVLKKMLGGFALRTGLTFYWGE